MNDTVITQLQEVAKHIEAIFKDGKLSVTDLPEVTGLLVDVIRLAKALKP